MSRRTNESLLDHAGGEPAAEFSPAALRITMAAFLLFFAVCVGVGLWLVLGEG